MNPLQVLSVCGQSVWLDYLSRDLIQSGELARRIGDDGISGVTTNPSIFQAAIAAGKTYLPEIRRLSSGGLEAESIAQRLIIEDVVVAADLLLSVYKDTGARDGFVSIEVPPRLAYDRDGTVREARDLWKAVGRPNVMIKVPATSAGISATRQLLTEGINVNSTLLFWLGPYRRVQEAYLRALESRAVMGLPLDSVASVASFFLSRIDSVLDPQLTKIARGGTAAASTAASLLGETAIACARLAYRGYEDAFSGPRFQALAARGARVQRLLWASTSTKNPAYSDTRYIESLVARDTVTTLPPETLDAFKVHGRPTIMPADISGAAWMVISHLDTLGFDMQRVGKRLEQEGVRKFAAAYAALVGDIRDRSGRAPSREDTLRRNA